MRAILLVGTLAAPFVLAGCANQGASYAASGETEPGYVMVKDGKRQDTLVGSRLARETRENSESVKSISRKAYKDAQTEKPGAPLNGHISGGGLVAVGIQPLHSHSSAVRSTALIDSFGFGAWMRHVP